MFLDQFKQFFEYCIQLLFWNISLFLFLLLNLYFLSVECLYLNSWNLGVRLLILISTKLALNQSIIKTLFRCQLRMSALLDDLSFA